MNDIVNIQGIECYEKDGFVYLKLDTVARGLGFTQEKGGSEYVRWETVNGYLAELGIPNKLGKSDFIPENVFYRLAMKAKNEVAERFQAKISDEVLPSIRKHGLYAVDDLLDNPDLAIKAFTALKEEREKNKALQTTVAVQEQVIGELKPKADYTDLILQNKGLVTISQIAKDYGMSGRSMNQLLHSLGVEYKQSGQWLLYSKYHDCGYTHSETFPITHTNGTSSVKMETKWTQKGRLFLYELLKENGVLPVIEKVNSQKSYALS